MSKLYTEEQVIDFAMSMISQYEFGNKDIWNKELLKESLDCKTSIELPSDEDIYIESQSKKENIKKLSFDSASFQFGAKWMRDKIQGGNNE